MPILKTTGDPSAIKRVPGATKAPEILAVFWVLKLLTTAMGESASDYLLNTNPVVGLPIGVVGFSMALCLQYRTPRYLPVAYWGAIAMVPMLMFVIVLTLVMVRRREADADADADTERDD